MAMPELQTFPPVVRVMELAMASPPGGGGRRRFIGSTITSATMSPNMAASMENRCRLPIADCRFVFHSAIGNQQSAIPRLSRLRPRFRYD
jgi:hypothetical protein